MGDGRALQCGLALPRAEFFEIIRDALPRDQNQMQFVWQTSWGVSTRLLGAS